MREICFLLGVTSVMHFIMERIMDNCYDETDIYFLRYKGDIREDISHELSIFVFCTQTLIFCRLDFNTLPRK